jgi:hypothetical protein
MSEGLIFVASIILIALLLVALVWLIFRIKYQYSVILDNDRALFYCLAEVAESYSEQKGTA